MHSTLHFETFRWTATQSLRFPMKPGRNRCTALVMKMEMPTLPLSPNWLRFQHETLKPF